MSFNFACRKFKTEDGVPFIKCRDLPEITSWPSESEKLEDWALSAVEDCLAFRMKDGTVIPEASATRAGEFVVRLPLSATAKILLHNAMAEARVSRSELARRTGLKLPEVTRLLNLRHATKVDSVADALRALGYELSLVTTPAK